LKRRIFAGSHRMEDAFSLKIEGDLSLDAARGGRSAA
jgi:hypothetical protein